jgi:hypothetical protein
VRQYSRGEFLRLSGWASAGVVLRRLEVLAQNDSGAARAAAVIQQYDSQGFHRTATDVDRRSGQWLADQARRAGGEATLEAFDIRRVDVRGAFVEAESRRAEGLPFFDGGFTDAAGITARIGPPEARLPFALVVINAAGISSEGRSIQALRTSTVHRGIVAVTEGGHEGLSPSNAVDFHNPYGLPVLQISTEDHLWLRDLTARGLPIRFVCDAARTPAQASNVVATVRGRQADLPPVVVMTPRSGWFHCASERGGGIACWLDAIRAVAAARPARSLIAIASSGHELGHFGLDAFLAKQAHLIKGAAAWIHLGANIGASGGAARLQASDDAIMAMADEALAKSGATIAARVPRGTRPGGEARNIHDGGGRYISLLGSGPFFHNVEDRWPAAVDLTAVSRFSDAVASLAVRLANS